MAEPIRFEIRRGQPVLAGDVVAERRGVRRERDLVPVNAAADPSSRRTVYWTFGDVAQRSDRETLTAAPVTYDLTFISPRPLGREHPRTHGHVHLSRGSRGEGLAEVYEVLVGRAGFLLQDLQPGPEASFAVLVTAEPGDVVVVPPDVYHATLNLGSTMLAVADVVCRLATDEYGALRAAGGMAYGVGTADLAIPNPRYRRAAPLQQLSAEEWGTRIRADLYGRFRRDPGAFAWLCDSTAFAIRFPEVVSRVTGR